MPSDPLPAGSDGGRPETAISASETAENTCRLDPPAAAPLTPAQLAEITGLLATFPWADPQIRALAEGAFGPLLATIDALTARAEALEAKNKRLREALDDGSYMRAIARRALSGGE